MLFRKKPKPQLSIVIPEPCKEKWDGMHVVDDIHRHCDSCAKNVVDFTSMSDDEVVSFFRDNKSHVCGRFKKEQLNRPYTPLPETTRPATWWKAAMLLPLTLFAKNTSAQQNDSVPVGDSLLANSDSLQTPMSTVIDSALAEVDSLQPPSDSSEAVVDELNVEIPSEIVTIEISTTGCVVATHGWCTPEPYLTGKVLPEEFKITDVVGMVGQPNAIPMSPSAPTLDFVPLSAEYYLDQKPNGEDVLSPTIPENIAVADPNEPAPDPIPPTLPERPWYEAIIPERWRIRKG